MSKWTKEHREESLAYNKQYNKARRGQVKERRATLWLRILELYGDKCPCCGEDLRAFGTIQHLNGGGSAHRQGKWYFQVLEDVINENDKSKYQILCWNCHLGAHHNGGVCPHKTGSSLRTVVV